MQQQSAIFPSSCLVAGLKRPRPHKEFGGVVVTGEAVAGLNPALPTTRSILTFHLTGFLYF